jgi:hypothetical protein
MIAYCRAASFLQRIGFTEAGRETRAPARAREVLAVRGGILARERAPSAQPCMAATAVRRRLSVSEIASLKWRDTV